MLKPGLSNNAYEFAAQINPDADLILRTLQVATPVGPAQLSAQPPGQIVKLAAQALPGPGGVLTAPLSGVPCVWYRSVFFPGLAQPPLPSIAPSDGPPMSSQVNVLFHRSMNTTEQISTAPFVVGEAGGAQLLVDPLVADVDTHLFAANDRWRGKRGVSHGLMVEWIVPPGAPVLALGRIGADGHLGTDEGAALLVSTKDEARIVSRDRRSRGLHQMGKFVIKGGLVARASLHWLRIALVAMVVALILFVLIVFLT